MLVCEEIIIVTDLLPDGSRKINNEQWAMKIPSWNFQTTTSLGNFIIGLNKRNT